MPSKLMVAQLQIGRLNAAPLGLGLTAETVAGACSGRYQYWIAKHPSLRVRQKIWPKRQRSSNAFCGTFNWARVIGPCWRQAVTNAT